jgi:putative hydrolase of the HAD superfamily
MSRNLIFDADDTLWENNVYFIDATEKFLDVMEAGQLDRDEARRRLTDAERVFVDQFGYGTAAYTDCLVQTARELLPDISEDTLALVENLALGILERDPIEVLPGVEDALRSLCGHHRLFLLTKGDDVEQRDKLTRSRLEQYFEHVEVAREKNVETYSRFARRLRLDPARTWMIGNSPRSDINPALAANMNAVYIPHSQTWEMELEEIEDPGSHRLRVVDSIADLLELLSSWKDEPAAEPFSRS